MKKGNTVALLPIGVFLVIYLGLGIVFVYVLKISMGFYKITHRRGVPGRAARRLSSKPRPEL